MNRETIHKNLHKSLREYDRVLSDIKQSLAAYEHECQKLIEKIGEARSFDEANLTFDALQEIQTDLAIVTFGKDIHLSSRMEIIVKEFDRLDEEYIRKYWFEKFQQGERWPL